MTVKFLRNLLILFAFAIVGHASAQYVPIHSIDSVDLSALEAHSIVIGKITAVTNKLNENRQEYRETDVDVLAEWNFQ